MNKSKEEKDKEKNKNSNEKSNEVWQVRKLYNTITIRITDFTPKWLTISEKESFKIMKSNDFQSIYTKYLISFFIRQI
jgi:C4-type Zn-finger protein